MQYGFEEDEVEFPDEDDGPGDLVEDSENEDEEDSEEIETKMKLKPKKKKAKPKIKNVKKPDIPLDMNYVKRYVKRPLFRADDAYVRMSGDT